MPTTASCSRFSTHLHDLNTEHVDWRQIQTLTEEKKIPQPGEVDLLYKESPGDMGLKINGIENGTPRFDNVRIPKRGKEEEILGSCRPAAQRRKKEVRQEVMQSAQAN